SGRAMPPLVTVDFVGWDVHKAIVDNLYANTKDEAHAAFKLPAYMQRGIDAGRLGNKTKAGFFKQDGKTRLALDPKTGDYKPLVATPLPAFVDEMKSAIRVGRYERAMDTFCTATGPEAQMLRRVVLGYISYGLMRVGDVVQRARDVDRIM